MSGEVHDPRPRGLPKQGERGPYAAHHPHHAVVDGLEPLLVGEVFETAHRAGPDGVDEHIEFAVPPLPHLSEQRLDALGVADIGDQSHGIGAAETRQLLSGSVKDGGCAADNSDACAVGGQASRRGEPHPATAADHYRSRVLKSEIHCVTLLWRQRGLSRCWLPATGTIWPTTDNSAPHGVNPQ